MSNAPASDNASPQPSPSLPPIVMYEFGPFKLDVVSRHLFKGDEVVPLTAKVFDTLLALVRQHGRPVTKEDLISTVWPGTFVSDDSLVQNISALRRFLGDDASQPTYIVTLARRGYRFIAPTIEHTEPLSVPVAPAPPVVPIPPRTVAAEPPASTIAPPAPADRRWPVTAAAFLAGVLIAGATGLVLGRAPSGSAAGDSLRFHERMPDGQSLRGNVAISPDGRHIAFAAHNGKTTRIWVRAIDAADARPLPNTEDGTLPFWSPDARFIGFNAPGEMRRYELATGSVRAIVTTHRPRPLGASWGPGDLVLYADLGKIFSVSASGGEPVEVAGSGASAELGELRWPQLLPDGKHFLFYAGGRAPERAGTYIGELGGQAVTVVVPEFRATFIAPDQLLYVRDGAVLAQTFDPTSGQLRGTAMTLPGAVSPRATFSGSANGLLATTDTTGAQQLVWMNRQGQAGGRVDFSKPIAAVTLSPNGAQALVSSFEAGEYELWLVDFARQVSTKVATDGTFSAWSPDGRRFAFTQVTGQGADLYVRNSEGAPDEKAWYRSGELKQVTSWSPDGKYVMFTKYTTREQTSQDLWLLPTASPDKPVPYAQTKASEGSGIISPDGRWIAYVSNETGTGEVYVQSFPTPGMKIRVSSAGGEQPFWRKDGRELFYVSADHALTSVPFETGVSFRPSPPRSLFPLPLVSGTARQVDVAPDGQRFLVVDWAAAGDAHVGLVTNWLAARRP